MPYQLAVSGPYKTSPERVTIVVEIPVGNARAAATDLIDAIRALSAPDIPLPRAAQEPLRIIAPTRKVFRDGVPLELSRLEFDLLLFLCRHPDQVHRRQTVMKEVWGSSYLGNSRTIDVHVRRLRAKLGVGLPIIRTVRGMGYLVERSGLFSIVE